MDERQLREIKNEIMRRMEVVLDEVLREQFGITATGDDAIIRNFISTKCVLQPNLEITSKNLYDAYKDWAESNEYFVVAHRVFSSTVESNFPALSRYKKSNATYWRGVDVAQ